MGENLPDFGLCKMFSDTRSKAKSIEEQIDKLDYQNLNFCSENKGSGKRIKSQSKNWNKIFANHRFISRYVKTT